MSGYLNDTAGLRHRLRVLTLQALPWSTANADEAERLVRQIAAASIVARNARKGAGQAKETTE